MKIPDILYAGDAIEWDEPFFTDENGVDYKASDGWTYKYRIINSAGLIQVSSADIAAAADGDDHTFTLTSAQTAGWTAGKYLATGYVTDGSTNQVTGRKYIEIITNVLTASTFDFRTHAKTTLDAIEAAIERRATKEQMQLSISTGGGSSRAIQFMSLEELIKARQYYKSLVDQETADQKIENGEQPGGGVKIQYAKTT